VISVTFNSLGDRLFQDAQADACGGQKLAKRHAMRYRGRFALFRKFTFGAPRRNATCATTSRCSGRPRSGVAAVQVAETRRYSGRFSGAGTDLELVG